MSDEKFQNKYRIPSARAAWHDYGGGAYFVTICTKNREHSFGEIHPHNKRRDGVRHVSDNNNFSDTMRHVSNDNNNSSDGARLVSTATMQFTYVMSRFTAERAISKKASPLIFHSPFRAFRVIDCSWNSVVLIFSKSRYARLSLNASLISNTSLPVIRHSRIFFSILLSIPKKVFVVADSYIII